MSNPWEQKAAEMLCVGLKRAEVDDRTRRLLDHGISGVLLYGMKLPGAVETHELIHLLKQRAGRPIFVAVDQEGGARSMLQNGFTRFPPLADIGREDDLLLTRQIGEVLGTELRAVGIDMTLGPVLDIATNPDNPIIGNRAFSSNPVKVARLAAAMAMGLQNQRVAACGKHFPGHGDTELDSNLELPVLNHRVERLENVELLPFEAAVSARFAAMMVAHILFPALDPVHPTSISRPILYGLLRQKLGYRGMVMSDDIDMGALRKGFSHEMVAHRGIEAGIDVFLCARRPESAESMIKAIAQGVDDGTIVPERVEAARRRIQALLHRYCRPVDAHAALEQVGSTAHARILERVRP